jgi:hypothetical protein
MSRGGNHPIALLAAWLFGFPAQGQCADVEVRIAATDRFETWTRVFAGKPFRSTQEPGRGPWQGLIVERSGPFSFGLAVIARDGWLHLIPRRWTLFGTPLPRWAMSSSHAREHGTDQRFNFDVEIGLPLFGKIVHYRGWLEEDAAR